MRRYFLTLGLCLVAAAPAVAQDAGDEGGGRGRGGRGQQRQFGDDADNAQQGGAQQGGGRGRQRQFGDDEGGDQGGGRGGRGFGGQGGFGQDGGFGRGGRGGGGGQNLLFAALDLDGDGEINLAELRKAVASLKKLDVDKNDIITQEEAGVGRGGGRFGGGDPAQFVDRMLENDANGDGKLTEDELPGFMAQMLGRADANGDGALDRQELTAMAGQMGRGFGGGGFGGAPGGGFGGPGGAFGGGNLIQQFDRNGDGLLQANEVPPQMMGMLRGADANGDGSISPDELDAVRQNMGGRFGGGFGRFGDQGDGGRGNQGGGRGNQGGGRGRPQADGQ